MNHMLRCAALAIASTCAAAPAFAQVNTVKFGAILYQTHARTNGISGIGVPPGADAEVGDATTALFTYERALSPNVGIELVLGVPPTIKADAAGSVAFLGKDILSAKNVAPTVFVSYHFGNPGDVWRPYAGVGVNYTKFTNVESRLAPKVEMSDSWGLAAHLGIDYAIDSRWGLFASVATLQVKSKLVATGATVLQTEIDFRPITYSIGASYRF